MNPIAVESTTLTTVAYDADRKLLLLHFQDQSTYQYFEVSVEVYEALLRTSSKGGFFNRVIRGRYVYART